MLAYNIFHTDLHPGNVLTSPSALVLIDFDKSYRFVDTEREAMRARSIQRWMRSAEKHGVGDALSHFIRGITEGESAARSES
jgi:predicted unusual protein kinase regulating ubiquinone biosynthesis (AarF/ABC1/UbiB family)